MRRDRRGLLAAAAVLLVPAVSAADIYKCESGGQLRYQQEPCATGERQQRSRQEVLPKPPAAAAEGVPQVDEGDEEAYEVFGFKHLCERVPGFSEKSAEAYAALEFAHPGGAARARREQSQPGVDKQQDAMLAKASEEQLRAMCIDRLLPMLKELAQPPNPAYATPQASWNAFMGALRRGDRAAALAVFVESNLKTSLQHLWGNMSDEQLADMADSFNSFAVGQSYGQFTEAYVTRRNGRAGIVNFVRMHGEWKIESM